MTVADDRSADFELPRNLEAERAVLGACLLRGAEAFDTAAAVLGAADFYRTAHRDVWRSLARLRERDVALDLVTVKADMPADVLERSGGPAYIASLPDGLPRSTNVDHYARIVAGLAARRTFVVHGSTMGARSLVEEAERLARLEDGPAGAAAVFIRATSIAPKVVDWIWRKRLAPGHVTALSGLPGAGKSLIAVDVAANLTTGFVLPDDGDRIDREPVDVAWIGHASEDDPATTIVPRFSAAGGDTDRLHVLDTGADVTLGAACDAAAALHPALVVIDSWAAWGADASSDSTTQAADRYRVFDRLRAQGAAVLTITHDRKGADEDVQAVSGAVQTTAKPRTVLHVRGDVLRCLKGNLAGRADSVAFMVEGVTVEYVEGCDSAPTMSGIRKALGLKSRPQQQALRRLLDLAVGAGRLATCDVTVSGRQRTGFVSPMGAKLERPKVSTVHHGSPRFLRVNRARIPGMESTVHGYVPP